MLDAYTDGEDEVATTESGVYPLQPLRLSKLHLEIVKTMVGALLNCTLDYGSSDSCILYRYDN